LPLLWLMTCILRCFR